MHRITHILTLLIVATLCGCTHELKFRPAGSMRLAESNYPVSQTRIDNIAYAPSGDYIFRFSASPATYRLNENEESGNGAVLDFYFTSSSYTIFPATYTLIPTLGDSLFSRFSIFPDVKDKSTTADTLVSTINSGILEVDTLLGHVRYQWRLLTSGGDSITGSFHGDAIHNYSTDRTPFGVLEIDTMQCMLAEPCVYQWHDLLSPNTTYYEVVFHSTDARFSDAGKQKTGYNLALGFMLQSEHPLSTNTYPLISGYDPVPALIYGHRLNNTAWGSYWQQMRNGSISARANITEGSATISAISEVAVTLNITLTDQLRNTVSATYSGPYSIRDIPR